MCIPAGFALDQEPLLGFVTAENILDGSGYHMVDTRLAIGRRRTFVEDIRLPLSPG